MPLPMVHLAIAVRLAGSGFSGRMPEFLLGSLAPDAIHARPGEEPADKDASHLRSGESLPDPVRIQTLLKDCRSKAEPLPSFAAGYAAHLIADRLWVTTIYADFKRNLSHLDPEALRNLYYLETDQVDFDLYRRVEWRPTAWDLLARASSPDFSPLLSADEIDRWREHTLHWFDELKQEPGIVPQYITDDLVHDFIERAVEAVSDFFSALRRPAM
jgi:hypothetical protein